MLNKLISMSMAIALTAVAATATVEQAEARGRGVGFGVGVAAGIVGLGILGAAAANSRPYGYYGASCYPGPRQCDYAGRRCWYDRYGQYVCGGGEYRCYRPTICP